MSTFLPMAMAPKDRTPVLLKVKSEQKLPERAADYAGLQFVGRYAGCVMAWCFAAPVGCGGIPDEWLEGWQPLPDSWLPMDSAPRDGTHVLLSYEGVGATEGWFESSYGFGDDDDEAEKWCALRLPHHGCGCCRDTNPLPVGWRPLPGGDA